MIDTHKCKKCNLPHRLLVFRRTPTSDIYLCGSCLNEEVKPRE
jgi:hypothetical protein